MSVAIPHFYEKDEIATSSANIAGRTPRNDFVGLLRLCLAMTIL